MLKHACYGATAALQLAIKMLRVYCYTKKVLIIASDISRYGFFNEGEPSQGSGAIAMVISQNPKILSIEPHSGIYTEDVMDFWKPNYLDEAVLDGKFSCQMYLKSLRKTWAEYSKLSKRTLLDHQWFCYHVSVPRLVETAHLKLFASLSKTISKEEILTILNPALVFGKIIGNCYTSSLFLSFISLMLSTNIQVNSRIAFYSYGSGSVGEFFSGILKRDYKKFLPIDVIRNNIYDREEVEVEKYEYFYKSHIDITKTTSEIIPNFTQGKARLMKVNNHRRYYEIR